MAVRSASAGVHVMPAVDDDRRRGAHLLDAARHLHAAQRLGHDIRVQLSGNRDHRLGGGERGQRVVRLMLAELGDRDLRVLPQRGAQRDQLSADGRGARDDLHLVPVAQHPGVVCVRPPPPGSASRPVRGGCGPITAVQPGLMMPAFSAAICSTVSPSHCMWSISTGPMTAASAFSTLVASQAPPMPTSTTATSHRRRRRTSRSPWRSAPRRSSSSVLPCSSILASHQVDQVLDLIPSVHEVVVAQRLAVDGDALVDAFQMRRGVQAGAHAVGAADGLRHASRGAFCRWCRVTWMTRNDSSG